ncbi:hypothetical protein [Thiomonas intermedia]|uniref:hypothetical protein n=1 Tax=Thiomonas intermedia TaxID=926 RepID=UPI0012AB985A|nr:hypothetical protein [Thiomonas intermedia]
MSALDRMLSAQAQTLNAMFCELSRRAARKYQQELQAFGPLPFEMRKGRALRQGGENHEARNRTFRKRTP